MENNEEEYKKLSIKEINMKIKELDKREINVNKILKKMTFSNMNQTAKFFKIVAMESENLNHHPDIQINHGTELIITLITNDIQALSQYDFWLAKKIDLIKI